MANAINTSGVSTDLAPLMGWTTGLVETGLAVQKEKKTSSILHHCEGEGVAGRHTSAVQEEKEGNDKTGGDGVMDEVKGRQIAPGDRR